MTKSTAIEGQNGKGSAPSASQIGPHLKPFDPRYWLMKQIGMICGFATSYPMNWGLSGLD